MAKAIVAASGGGGAGSDECTAAAGDVLKGKTYVGSDTDDEVGTGTMPDNTSRTSNGSVPGLDRGSPNNPTRRADYMWLTTCTDGVKRLSMCPPKGYYNGNGGAYVNRDAVELGTVQPINVLRDHTFTSQEGLNIKGTMPNLTTDTTIGFAQGNQTPVIPADQIFDGQNTDGVRRICLRYNGQNGYIWSNTLFGFPINSFGTVEAKHVVKGGTFTSANGGIAGVGTLEVYSLESFSVAAYSPTEVVATWQWPWAGPYSGVAICGKKGGYPANIGDSRLYTGAGSNHAHGAQTSVIIGGLEPGQTYYFSAWVYCNTNNIGDMYSPARQAVCATKPRGQQIFTQSGIFTVPAGVTSVDMFIVGGGGGGTGANASSASAFSGGGGGAGGYTITPRGIQVSPGQQLNVTIGGGGAAGTGSNSGGTGGSSSVGSWVAAGGRGSNWHAPSGRGGLRYGGAGGSGGAGGWVWNGAADGGNADITTDASYKATGQGRTTRAFEESGGTLYAGGGGGGGARYNGEGNWAGNGGAGGGGTTPHNVVDASGVSGSANTGGGGSGGSAYYDGRFYKGNNGGAGGSGIVIIRWGY